MTIFADEMVGNKHPVSQRRTEKPAQSEPAYVQWEPGIGAAPSLKVQGIAARAVDKVPEVRDVKTAAADAWFETPAVANLMAVRDRATSDCITRVAILRDATSLFVAFECMETDFSRLHRLVPRDAKHGELRVYETLMARVLDHDDNVGVRIDAGHDHVNSYWLRVNVNGARRASRTRISMSWAAVPVWDEEVMADEARWESEVVELKDRWRCAMKIDMASIGVDAAKQGVVGVQLERARYGDCLRHYVSGSTLQCEFGSPLAYNDLYLDDAAVMVRDVRWAERRFGENALTVALENSGPARKVKIAATLQGTPFESEAIALPAKASGAVNLAYLMPHSLERATLALDLQDVASGKSLWRGSFPLANHAQLNVIRAATATSADDPSPDAIDFHARKIAYIQSRLPKFVRKNTAQGAASDFVLESADGTVTFNLMEHGALAKIGAWIDSLFDNAVDRVVAAALFSNDNAITTHCAARVSMHHHITALSALRLGAGHCYSRALAGTGIVNAMTDPRTGRHFEAHPCLVVGHVVVAIKWRNGYTFIDPSFGDFFFNRANTDLATDLELEADHTLIERVSARSHAIPNYGRRDVHVRLEEGTIVWPAGAPPK